MAIDTLLTAPNDTMRGDGGATAAAAGDCGSGISGRAPTTVARLARVTLLLRLANSGLTTTVAGCSSFCSLIVACFLVSVAGFLTFRGSRTSDRL